MKTTRFLLIALLTGASLLAPIASQAKTVFERFAPPLLLPVPIPVPVPVPGYIRGPEIRVETAPAWRGDYYREDDRRYDHYDRRYDHYDRRDWRDDRRDYRHDYRHDRRDHRDHRGYDRY